MLLASRDRRRETATGRWVSRGRPIKASQLGLNHAESFGDRACLVGRSTTSASPAYHYEPDTNGCVEKCIQTLKEQVLWIERFATHERYAPACGRSPAPTAAPRVADRAPRLPDPARGA